MQRLVPENKRLHEEKKKTIRSRKSSLYTQSLQLTCVLVRPYSYSYRTDFSHATESRTDNPSKRASRVRKQTQSFRTRKQNAQANSILPNTQAERASKPNPSEHASKTRKQTQSFRTRKQNSNLPKAEACAVTWMTLSTVVPMITYDSLPPTCYQL